jgi:hypothetical protein
MPRRQSERIQSIVHAKDRPGGGAPG